MQQTKQITPMTKLFFFTLSATLLFINADCKKDIVDPPNNPLQLTVEDVSCIEATLKISLAHSEQNRNVIVKRNDSIIFSITLTKADSVVTDANLLPQKTYTYTATAGSWKATTQATTQDTTSHQIQWQLPDTLGAQGVIRDVWVFSKTDAWAVGEIYLADSSGKIDGSNPYNAAHWNGNSWTVKQILVKDFGNGTGYIPLQAIFAFGAKDIWFASSSDFIHWDGMQFSSKAFFALQLPFEGQVRKIWGTSPNNLYCVGRTGAIYHYTNPGTWTKMESNTTVDLEDIWGIDETHIWATGTTTSDGKCVVLQYDGKQWKTIYDNANKPLNEIYGFKTVWSGKSNNIFLAGDAFTSELNVTTKNIKKLITIYSAGLLIESEVRIIGILFKLAMQAM